MHARPTASVEVHSDFKVIWKQLAFFFSDNSIVGIARDVRGCYADALLNHNCRNHGLKCEKVQVVMTWLKMWKMRFADWILGRNKCQQSKFSPVVGSAREVESRLKMWKKCSSQTEFWQANSCAVHNSTPTTENLLKVTSYKIATRRRWFSILLSQKCWHLRFYCEKCQLENSKMNVYRVIKSNCIF